MADEKKVEKKEEPKKEEQNLIGVPYVGDDGKKFVWVEKTGMDKPLKKYLQINNHGGEIPPYHIRREEK